MSRLNEKTAIVTGATSGIGEAAALLFAQEGANLVLSGRRQEKLGELVARIEALGARAIAVAGDVRDERHAQACVTTAIKQFGGLDVAFNNAGAATVMGSVTRIDPFGWQETIDTCLTSAYLGARHQVPAMLENGGGSLIFTSSFVGNTVGFPGMAAYAAAKAGLVGLVQTLAAEYGARGVRANALLPGGVDTPSNAANLPDAAPETRGFIEGLHALKRLGTPEELAEAALFLASDASRFMTGASMLVDGGVSITRT
ncbi:SDR family oxidoreductase [Pelagibacterium xiamenense]|uniref:SDR family oxidoreductase n=1 Tax=Pelagibacterium xiamenense TaxID=2901140 RepID=UPI001E5753AD|nr:SDR family oxidoreductase [Pelagibacterium xiamenense]MCD7060105.1 SDR family oxidoreductase [Pelagibacterium xiamenense]